MLHGLNEDLHYIEIFAFVDEFARHKCIQISTDKYESLFFVSLDDLQSGASG